MLCSFTVHVLLQCMISIGKGDRYIDSRLGTEKNEMRLLVCIKNSLPIIDYRLCLLGSTFGNESTKIRYAHSLHLVSSVNQSEITCSC